MSLSDRVVWIDLAKGICIVAVVSLYAAERVAQPDGANWMDAWVRFARPFRMPDFFLISGLFLSRSIRRPLKDYLDTKAVHYLYFFVLWTLIDFPFVALAGKAGDAPREALARLVGMLSYEPYAMLWFIQMLAVYFVLARLLRPAPVWLVFPLAALWQMFPLSTSLHQIDRIGERFVYFYAGYAFAPWIFRFADWAGRNRGLSSAALIAWAAINQAFVSADLASTPGVALALGFSGAAAVIAASSLLSKLPAMRWLGYLGERSIVIYLSFLIPMTALLLVVGRVGWPADRGSLAALLTIASILSALALGQAARGTFLRYLFERPRWAALAPAGADGRPHESGG